MRYLMRYLPNGTISRRAPKRGLALFVMTAVLVLVAAPQAYSQSNNFRTIAPNRTYLEDQNPSRRNKTGSQDSERGGSFRDWKIAPREANTDKQNLNLGKTGSKASEKAGTETYYQERQRLKSQNEGFIFAPAPIGEAAKTQNLKLQKQQ